MNRSDVENFFKTLILGDFEESQNSSAQLVGGLISLIPILGQVMAARDITGTLFNISAKGGFKSATSVQLVNLGFAAFGAVPEVGPVFKTIFKPMWKERQLAKGAVSSGLHAIEAMLGMSKGGAIGWIRKEVLGKWAPLTQQAIIAVNDALQLCISLLDFLSSAEGWKSWLIPSSVQALSKALLPQVKSLQGTVNEPLQRASNEIREFLSDVLGEQAAGVLLAVGQHAVQASAVPATRTRSGHNAADVHPVGAVPARQGQQVVQTKDKLNAHKGAGLVDAAAQTTRKLIENMAAREKGLVGEHMVDYHELARLGGHWPHDQATGSWSPAGVAKLNDQRRKGGTDKGPIHIKLSDLGEITRPGIDAVWQHGTSYTVTEAKASASVATLYAMGKYKEKKGLIPVVSGLSKLNQELHYALSDSSDKGGVDTPMMQMSEAWVKDRASREGLDANAQRALEGLRGIRRVVLVTFESTGAVDHAESLVDVSEGKTGDAIHSHTDHGDSCVWEAAAIDTVEKARLAAHELTKSAPTPDVPAPKTGRSRT